MPLLDKEPRFGELPLLLTCEVPLVAAALPLPCGTCLAAAVAAAFALALAFCELELAAAEFDEGAEVVLLI